MGFGQDSQNGIGYAELEAQLEQQFRLQEIITTVANHFLQSTHETFEDAIAQTQRAICDFAGADKSFLFWIDEASQTITAVYTQPDDTFPGWSTYLDQLPVAQIPWLLLQLQRGEPLLVSSVEDIPLEAALERILWQALELQAMILVPLMRQGALLGCLGYVAEQVPPPELWQVEDAHVLTAIRELLVNAWVRHRAEQAEAEQQRQLAAAQSSIAIQNGRRFEQEQLLRREIELVQRASFSLISSLDLPQVLDDILETALILVPFQDANIFLVEEDRLVFGAAITEGGRKGTAFAEPRSDGLTYTVLHTGQTIVVTDSKYHPLFQDAPREWGRFAILGQPLKVRGDVVGVMNVATKAPAAFSESERRVLNLLATYAAVAIQNARLHERSIRHAAELEERVAERTAELRRESNRLRAVLDSAGDGIHFSNAKGVIQYVNAATERITGYQADELIGQTPRIWRGTTQPAVIDELEQCWMRGESWQGEVVNRHKDGTLYDAHINISPILNGEGRFTGYVEVQRDITKLRELEQLKNQFVSRIGHELRTPITNMKLYLDLLDRQSQGAYDRYLQVLQLESERLERLVTGFMEISQLNAGNEPLQMQVIDLDKSLAERVVSWQPILAQRQLTLDTRIDSPLSVLGDAELIGRVVDKLLGNATKYTPAEGSVTLSVGCQTNGEKDWVTVTVQDTGPGIAPAEIPRIFERFYRGEAARDFRVPGAGLGLAFCQEALQKMGGKITAATVSEGGGAAITIWLQPA